MNFKTTVKLSASFLVFVFNYSLFIITAVPLTMREMNCKRLL